MASVDSKVAAFVAANAESPVVKGELTDQPGGIRFTLEDGREFKLSPIVFRALPSRARWLHD